VSRRAPLIVVAALARAPLTLVAALGRAPLIVVAALRRAPLVAVAALTLLAGVVLAGCGSDEPSGSTPSGASAGEVISFAPSSRTFVGISASEVLPLAAAEQRKVLHAQAAAGIGLFRQTFRWDEIEPSPGQYEWGMHDGLVAAAAESGIRVLPIVFATPKAQAADPKPGAKVTPTTTMPPRDPQAFAAFATVLAKRYGPGGAFWKAHPDLEPLPIRSWQVWNEPNLKAYWGGRPNQNEYLELLKVTGRALHAVDPQAEIVTGGVPESKLGIPLGDYVSLLARAGAKGSFDTLAIHPYARTPDGAIAAIVHAREILDRAGFGDVGLWVTEIGWATGEQQSDFTVGPKTQAAYIAEFLRRSAALAPRLKLRGIAYYAWRDVEPYPGGKDFWGLHTGLHEIDGAAKPSLAAFTSAAAELRAG
jgi:hypothetical protein